MKTPHRNSIPAASFARDIRAYWVERFVASTGAINSAHVIQAFGCTRLSASGAMQDVMRHHPGFMAYDMSAKIYRWTGKPPKLPLPRPFAAVEFQPLPQLDPSATVA